MSNLDLRDLAKELDELREKQEQYEEDNENDPLDEDEQEKLKELVAMEDALGDLGVYARNIDSQLIDEDSFEDYTRETAKELGAVKDVSSWIVIDWEATADNLKADYTDVEYEGNTYLIRAG